jgi:transcriptional regulator with XRE-family HTH domain
LSDNAQGAANLRYLLWKAGKPKDRWPTELATWLGCDAHRALALLRGEPPSAGDLRTLAARTGIPEDDLPFVDLTANLDVLGENLRFLIDGLEHGKKGELAGYMGVNRGTLSSWLGKKRPKEANLQKLRDYFGLPTNIDLRRDPLFLRLHPVGEMEQRAWLHQRVDELPGDELRELFPALRKLLKDG